MPVLETVPVSSVLTEEVRRAYLSSRLQVTRRITIYEADGETLWNPANMVNRLISGGVSVDSDRDERRTLDSLTLFNKDGLLNQNSEGGFWYDKIIKAYRGLIYRDAAGLKKKFEVQIGEFMIDTMNDQRFPKSITINCRDYAKKLMLDKFGVDTTFAAGQKLDDLVKIIATNGGIKKYRLDATGITVGTAPTFARNTSRWEAIKGMCEGLNIEVYFDHEGYLVTRKFDDVSTVAPIFNLSLEEGKENIIDFSKSSSDANIFNHVVVTGTSEEETVTGYKFISQRENNDPESPTCIAKIGRRTFPLEVSYLTTQAQADDLAVRLLRVKQLEDFTLSFSSPCLPWLEAGKVLGFRDPFASDTIPTRFLFSQFNVPLELAPMPGTGKRIVIVGLDENEQAGIDFDVQ